MTEFIIKVSKVYNIGLQKYRELKIIEHVYAYGSYNTYFALRASCLSLGQTQASEDILSLPREGEEARCTGEVGDI